MNCKFGGKVILWFTHGKCQFTRYFFRFTHINPIYPVVTF